MNILYEYCILLYEYLSIILKLVLLVLLLNHDGRTVGQTRNVKGLSTVYGDQRQTATQELQIDLQRVNGRLTRHWIGLETLEIGHDVDQVKDVAVLIGVGGLVRLQGEGAVIKGEPTEVFEIGVARVETSEVGSTAAPFRGPLGSRQIPAIEQ